MGRKSSLTPEQWDEISKRLLAGERAAALAVEFGVSKTAISRRFSQPIATVKSVANQIVAAEVALKALPISQQIIATDLVNQLRSISGHLAGAANFGAATAHRLAGIANAKVAEIDDAAPLGPESIEALKGIAALTRLSNDAASTGLNLLSANKDAAKGALTPPDLDAPSDMTPEEEYLKFIS